MCVLKRERRGGKAGKTRPAQYPPVPSPASGMETTLPYTSFPTVTAGTVPPLLIAAAAINPTSNIV